MTKQEQIKRMSSYDILFEIRLKAKLSEELKNTSYAKRLDKDVEVLKQELMSRGLEPHDICQGS